MTGMQRVWSYGLLFLLAGASSAPAVAAQNGVASNTTGVESRDGQELLARLVTITVTRVTRKQAFRALAAAARIPVEYDAGLFDRYRDSITVRCIQMPIRDVLAQILSGTSLRAVVDGGTQLAIVDAGTRGAQGVGTLVARATDSVTGRGLVGAMLQVQGTGIRIVSGDDGRFPTREVASGSHDVSVRLLGYRSVIRHVVVPDGGQVTVLVALTPAGTQLTEVVTTASGMQRKVELGNDITTINVDSVMQTAPIATLTDLLETRVPGLTVQHSSGSPGDPSRIRLRGASSITRNNDPIVIVDGIRVYASQSDQRNANIAGGLHGNPGDYAVPSPLDQIDPNTIDKVEVLKGPSASSLYGSDAANGVIVITTKHGSAGQTHWRATAASGVNAEPGNWPVNYYRFGQNVFGAGPTCAWNDLSCTVDSVVPFQALNDPAYTIFGRGSTQSLSGTVSGGTPALLYALTGTGTHDLGLLKLPGVEQKRYEGLYGPLPGWMARPEQYNTWGGTANVTAQPATTLHVTLTTSLFNSNQQKSSLLSGVTQLMGSYIDPDQLGTTPLITNDVERATSAAATVANSVVLDWRVTPWLPLTITAGTQTVHRTDETLVPYGINSNGAGAPTVADTDGNYNLGRGSSQDNTLAITTQVPLLPQRWLTLAMGGSVTKESTADIYAGTATLSPGVTTPSAFPYGASFVQQNVTGQATYGWFIEPRLDVLSKLFVQPGFRLDGGTASGTHAGLTALPKISVSYLAVDRQADEGGILGPVTQFRPRLAFGLAGVQPGPTDKYRLFNVGGYGSAISLDGGTTTVPGVSMSTLGNTQLRPERGSELELGFDLTLWNDRVSMTYTHAGKVRNDAIISVPIAASVAGGGTYEKNIGQIKDASTELSLNARVLDGDVLAWDVGMSATSTHSKVTRLNPGQAPLDLSNGTRVVAGYPLFGRWAVPIISFADANHNGIIEPSEIRYGDSLVYVGEQVPNYEMNFTTDWSLWHGRFGIHATVAYQAGLSQYNQGLEHSQTFLLGPNAPGTTLAQQAAVVAAATGKSDIGMIQTVNTLRFNSLSINYTVPSALTTRLRIPTVQVALQGSNLGLHTNYRGKDPDVNAFSIVPGAGDMTEDSGQIPEPRVWRLQFSVGN